MASEEHSQTTCMLKNAWWFVYNGKLIGASLLHIVLDYEAFSMERTKFHTTDRPF